MVILSIFLLLIPGALAVRYFLRDRGLLEQTGAIIFFSLTLVPFVNINFALLYGKYISTKLTLLTSLFLIALFTILILYGGKTKAIKEVKPRSSFKDELWPFIMVCMAGIIAGYYYSNKEFVLSLGSYLIKKDAGCFYMQAFKTISNLNPDFKYAVPVNKVYEIICTPGNILFTATVLSLFKVYSFKIVYVLFTCLLFIFSYLMINKLLADKFIALFTAIFAVFNPYVLSVEVLDRNIMALTISAILFYFLLEHKRKKFLHGLIFGILAGTGLRFLPLLFIVPILISYYRENSDVKAYLIFISGFIITFTFNTPHLFFNGFNSLGETKSSLSLILEAIKKWERTPFLPYPNIVFYLLNILNYFGYLFSGIILMGAFNLFKTDKKLFIVFTSLFLSVFLILSYQRNWIEADKYRIIITAFLSLYVFLGYGLKYLFTKAAILRKAMVGCVCAMLPVVFVRTVSIANFSQDTGFYQRKHIYQRESKGYHALQKKFLLRIGLLPNYKRLFAKLDFYEKKTEEKVVFRKIFPEGDLPNNDKFHAFYSDWQRWFLKNHDKKSTGYLHTEFVYLKINFDKLVTDTANAVERMGRADICAIDLANMGDLFDVYYADLNVNWQKELLPVCVMLNDEEIKYLNELNIDLNAFISLNKDNGGFDVVNLINFKGNSKIEKNGLQPGMSSFPLINENNTMIFRVPKDLKVIIRNWFVNENGIPYKVDGWCIKQDKKGNYRADFFYNEPETYL